VTSLGDGRSVRANVIRGGRDRRLSQFLAVGAKIVDDMENAGQRQ